MNLEFIVDKLLNNDNPDKKFDKFLKELGVDKEYLKVIVTCDYYKFIDYIKEEIKKCKINGDEVPQNLMDDYGVLKEDYATHRSMIIESLQFYLEENSQENKKEWRFPFKEIFNGNFPKLDKTKLTPEMKIAFNVDGLLDDCFDLYIDKEFNKVIPIYYDFSTINQQWVAFAFYLEEIDKDLKVGMNWRMPLLLFDRDLMGIDIDTDSLDPTIAAKAQLEVEKNPIYTLREAGRTFDEKTDSRKPSELTIGTWTFLWLYCQRFNIYREQPRQTGKTFDITKLVGLDWAAGLKNAKVLIVHFKQSEAGKNRKMMIDSANLMPKFLKFHTVKSKKVKGVVKEIIDDDFSPSAQAPQIINDYRQNYLKIFAVGTSAQQAEKTGRGDSPQIVHVDEINFIRHTSAMLAGIMFAHGTARLIAERANKRYGIFFTSTPGKLNTDSGRSMYNLVFNQMCQFDIKLFGYSYSDLSMFMQKNASKHFFNISYNYDELGFAEDWLEERIAQSDKREDFMTDILLRWLETTENSLYSQKHMGRIGKIVKQTPHRTFMYNKYHKFTYFSNDNIEFEDYIKSFHAVGIGIDIAYGGKGDSTTMYCIDLETLQPIFAFKNNEIDVTDFSFLLVKFLEWLKIVNPDLLIVLNPEIDGPGQVLLANLLKFEHIEKMIIHTREFTERYYQHTEIKSTNKRVKGNVEYTYGTRQNSNQNRAYLTEKLMKDLVDKYPYAFKFEPGFIELGTMRVTPNGKRIEHKSGCHDDVVFSILLAYAIALKPDLRLSLEKYFNFIVDFSKIKIISLTSVIDTTKEDPNRDKEGTIDYTIVPTKDIYGREYDEIIAFKIVNGKRTQLTLQEIEYEWLHGAFKDNPDFKTIRIKNLASEIGVRGAISNKMTSNVSIGEGRAKSVIGYNKYRKHRY